MKKEFTVFTITAIIIFIMVSIIYFKPILENYISWAVVGLTLLLATIIYALRGGAIPSMLITKHLPFPLALISPPSAELKELFKTRILPAVQSVIELSGEEISEKSYPVIKHIREFFNKELDGGRLGGTEGIKKKLASMGLYSNIRDNEERKNFLYSLASLIHWIIRYRNLVMHTIDPDPIDSWFALRTTLIYIRDRYPMKKASLNTKCPKCSTTNTVELYEDKTHWLQQIKLKCTKCRNMYKIKLTPTIIAEHYQL